MDRPKPGGGPCLSADCAESPASTSSLEVCTIDSSSHPPSLVASCLPRCRSAACLVWGTLALSHRTVRGTLRRLSQYLSYVFPRRRRQYQKGLGQSGILLTRHAFNCTSRYGRRSEEVIRLTLLEGVPSRSHSTPDTHADSGRSMPIAEYTPRLGADYQTNGRVSTARDAFPIRGKASSRDLARIGLVTKRPASPNPPFVCPVAIAVAVAVAVAVAAAAAASASVRPVPL